jgi:hypothetical protein
MRRQGIASSSRQAVQTTDPPQRTKRHCTIPGGRAWPREKLVLHSLCADADSVAPALPACGEGCVGGLVGPRLHHERRRCVPQSSTPHLNPPPQGGRKLMRCARRRLTLARRKKTGDSRALQTTDQHQRFTGLGRASRRAKPQAGSDVPARRDRRPRITRCHLVDRLSRRTAMRRAVRGGLAVGNFVFGLAPRPRLLEIVYPRSR